MSNQTNKKALNNRVNNQEMELEMSLRSIWLGMRDSNPRSWDQNPVPYRLANPQYIVSVHNYTNYLLKLLLKI